MSFGRKKKCIFVNRVIESHSGPIKAKWRKILEWSSPLTQGPQAECNLPFVPMSKFLLIIEGNESVNFLNPFLTETPYFLPLKIPYSSS